ncbi:M20/M25/M40 family metallo-hydrolase [Bacteriovoracaceae bacterium]|nr:M20/M25/M40 family metallo-hydrolase [Bacteriovoracaceae bacterium]
MKKLIYSEYFEKVNLERDHFWKQLLVKVSSISSKSSDVKGVNEVQQIIAELCLKMGLTTELIKNQVEESGDLLIAQTKGDYSKYITLICHSDTVFELNAQRPIYEDSGKLFGPGVIDDKGGMVVALRSLYMAMKQRVDTSTGIRFVCSPNEETGSTGFHKIFDQLKNDSDYILGFEPAIGAGDVILGRKGNRWYDIEFKGIKAHAGRHHQNGLNACSELSQQLSYIHQLTNYEVGTTVNIGKIDGGQAHNVVSDCASAQLDVRFNTFETKEHVCEQIEESLNQSMVESICGTKSVDVSFEVVDDCPPFNGVEESEELFHKLKSIYQSKFKKDINYHVVGGAADINYFSSPGKKLIDGLGPLGEGMHTENEYVDLESINTRSLAVTELIQQIQKGVI